MLNIKLHSQIPQQKSCFNVQITYLVSDQRNIIFQFLTLEINDVLFSLSKPVFGSDKSLYNYIFRELYNHFL